MLQEFEKEEKKASRKKPKDAELLAGALNSQSHKQNQQNEHFAPSYKSAPDELDEEDFIFYRPSFSDSEKHLNEINNAKEINGNSSKQISEKAATTAFINENKIIVNENKNKNKTEDIEDEFDLSLALDDTEMHESFITASGLRRVIRDTPIAELTLRKYEMPYEDDKRELLRKFCLSIGLLQPGDSRDIIVDVLHVLMTARKEKKLLSSDGIRLFVIEERKKQGLPLLGIASSNIRRQIKRLRDIFIVEKVKNEYTIAEFMAVEEIFKEKIESYLLPSIMARVKEYIKAIDKKYG